jgi:hypothetical protein
MCLLNVAVNVAPYLLLISPMGIFMSFFLVENVSMRGMNERMKMLQSYRHTVICTKEIIHCAETPTNALNAPSIAPFAQTS